MAGVIDQVRRYRRFLTFCAVGGSGVLVNMVVFAVVLRLWPDEGTSGANAVAINVAGLLGWVVSVLTNYALNDRLTFADQTSDRTTGWWLRAGRYYVSATAALAVQLAVLNAALWLLGTAGWLAIADPLAGSTDLTGDMLGLLTSGALVDLGGAVLLRWAPECCNLLGIAAGTVANYALAKGWVFK